MRSPKIKFLLFVILTVLTVVGLSACSSATAATQSGLEQELADAQAQIESLTAELASANEHSMEDMDSMESMSFPDTVVYGFGAGQIAVIDPETGMILKTLEFADDIVWSDPILSPDGKYVFVNERTNSQVLVISTETHELIKSIDVGGRPVHIYNPNHGDEIWTHSDEEGAFYVINIGTLEVTDVVVAAYGGTGHGKLAYGFENKGYGTNTNDPAIFAIDLDTKENITDITLCANEDGEGGTHAKTYSPTTEHVYIECTRVPWVEIVDPATDTVIGQITEGKGQLFTTPDGKYVVIMDKGQGFVHVVDGTDTVVASIVVPDAADKIAFVEMNGTLYGFTGNTAGDLSHVINFDTLEVEKTIAVGAIYRDPEARFFHRSIYSGGKWATTAASGDQVISIIDGETLTLQVAVPLEGAYNALVVGGHH